MERKKAQHLGLLVWGFAVFLSPAVLDADDVAIVVRSDANEIARFAGQELQRHLGLILGQKPRIETASRTGGLNFYVGVRPPNDAEPFQQLEEARYTIDDNGVYLYGDDEVVFTYDALEYNVTKSGAIAHNRMGTLFAVYFFLEEELGVRWIEPGDAGISYERRQRLEFTPKRRVWRTHCPYERRIRSYVWDGASRPSASVPKAFLSTKPRLQSAGRSSRSGNGVCVWAPGVPCALVTPSQAGGRNTERSIPSTLP